MFDLKDRVIVLTGSTGVLASALATSLAKAKAKLFILGRNKNLLLELKKSIERYTVVEYYVADVLERSELEAVCASIVKKTGRIDVLINAVGGNLPGAVIPDEKSTSAPFVWPILVSLRIKASEAWYGSDTAYKSNKPPNWL